LTIHRAIADRVIAAFSDGGLSDFTNAPIRMRDRPFRNRRMNRPIGNWQSAMDAGGGIVLNIQEIMQ
jgi:hypothetical protein